ncbi:MAG: NAD(P)/FAD-dependent oxidoreductase [Helicobacteraceae bacterium]|jgi:NADH dehydrogenase|nr:NAD(P)/FAD-dependent oxidoreductase [Helicobacteraceae bacterium]
MKKIIVIGGGYGGLRAVENLAGIDGLHITLIDKHPYHYLQTEAYGYIAGRFDLPDIAVDLKNWCFGFKKWVEFLHDEVTYVDFKDQTVQLSDKKLHYDYLIMAIGAETNFFSFIEGLRENSFGVKKLQRAFNFRTAFERLLYNKMESPLDSDKGVLNIAIGGAGLSGVEIAAEMADVIKKHTKSIGESTQEIKIYLIDASSTILPGMSDYIIKNTHQRLEELGINIMTDSFIERVNSTNICFKDGRQLDFFFMIFTGGIKVPSFKLSREVERNRINQFIVNEYLRIPEASNVFAIGDCVEIHDAKGEILPPTAQTAERSAEYVAKNIKHSLVHQKVKPFDASIDGVFVALGGKYAVGEMFKVIKVKGYSAYLLKKLITYTYYIGLKLRVNTGFKKRTETLDK